MIDLKRIEQHVKNRMEQESSGHDYLHAKRVVKNCALFIEEYDVDESVIFASAWIHDLIDHKLSDEFKSSELELEALLISSGFTQMQTTSIFEIIQNISYSKGTVPDSFEGKIVQDADRLDALGAIGIARTFAYGGKNNRLIYSETSKDRTTSLAHFDDKLFKLASLMNTKKGVKLAQERIVFMRKFIDTLNTETM